MNYCGSPINNLDFRFLETFNTVDTKPIDIGQVEKDYKFSTFNFPFSIVKDLPTADE
jgi:hypothetical protein